MALWYADDSPVPVDAPERWDARVYLYPVRPRKQKIVVCRAMRRPRQQCQARVLDGSDRCADHQPGQP